MPKNDNSVVGPSVVSSARGTPSSLQVAMVMARDQLHSSDCGEPQRRKSSSDVGWP